MEFIKSFKQAVNSHVLMVAFLIGLFATVLIGLQQALLNSENKIKDSLAVLVFLQTNMTEAEAQPLMESLKSQDPEIQSISFTSRDQAYQEALKDPNLAKPLLLLKTNPLPATFSIRLSDRAWWERDNPQDSFKTIPHIQEIRWDPQASELFRTLHQWRLWTLRFSAFVVTLLVVWALMGFYRFLSLNSQWREMATQLVIGLIGGGLAWGLWSFGIHSLQTDLSPVRPVWMWVLPLGMGAIAALGCFGINIRHAD